MTKTIDEYQNLVELLKQALTYYADDRVYKLINIPNNPVFASIFNDGGFQAKFALKKIEELEKLRNNLEEEFVKNITTSIENEESIENTLKIIEEFKKISNEIS